MKVVIVIFLYPNNLLKFNMHLINIRKLFLIFSLIKQQKKSIHSVYYTHTISEAEINKLFFTVFLYFKQIINKPNKIKNRT